MDKKRVEWIDFAKCIGIIFVISGHVIFPYKYSVWVYSFHMPLFFFLSGITFNYKEICFKHFLKRKFASLMIPYFIFSMVNYLWILNKHIQGVEQSLLKNFFAIFIQIRGTKYGIGLWFIPCLFLAELLFYIIVKNSKNKKTVFAISTAIYLIGYLYGTYVGVALPHGIDLSLIAVFFIMLGFIVSSKLHLIKKMKYATIFLIINIISVNANFRVLNTRVELFTDTYGNLLFFTISAISGILFIICICQIIPSNKIIRYIGKNSIVFYCIHFIALEILLIIVESNGIRSRANTNTLSILLGVSTVTIAIITVVPFVPIMNKLIKLSKRKFLQNSNVIT